MRVQRRLRPDRGRRHTTCDMRHTTCDITQIPKYPSQTTTSVPSHVFDVPVSLFCTFFVP